MTTPKRLRAENSLCLEIDLQEKLLAKLPSSVALIRNAGFMLDVAAALTIPVLATEQYPRGLGPTAAEIARRLTTKPIAKTSFSCCGANAFREELERPHRTAVVLIGIETHVCIAQTALDLLQAEMSVFLAVDAMGARGALDHDFALRRLEQAGAVLTTTEAIAFEWLQDSTNEQFKNVSALVVARGAKAT